MRTTATIPEKLQRTTLELCQSINIKMSLFVQECLRRKMKQIGISKFSMKKNSIRYQAKGEKYVRIHVSFDWDEYHSNIFSRISRKYSVSYLISKAIDEFSLEVKNEIVNSGSPNITIPLSFTVIKVDFGDDRQKKNCVAIYTISYEEIPP